MNELCGRAKGKLRGHDLSKFRACPGPDSPATKRGEVRPKIIECALGRVSPRFLAETGFDVPGGRVELPRGFNSPTDFKSGASAIPPPWQAFIRKPHVALCAPGAFFASEKRGAGRNRTAVYRFCRPAHYHFATAPRLSQRRSPLGPRHVSSK